MRQNPAPLRACFAAAVSISVFSASDVKAHTVSPSQMALDQCATRAEVLAGLAEENQYPLVTADLQLADGNTGEPVNLRFAYFSSVDMSKGYEIYANFNGDLCKGKDLSEIVLLDNRNGNFDNRSYVTSDGGHGETNINRIIKNAYETSTQSPMLMARLFGENQKIAIVGNSENLNGSFIVYSSLTGRAVEIGIFINVKYSTVGISTLER